MEEKVFFRSQGGLKICALMNEVQANGHIVIMLHGLPSSKNSKTLNALREKLNQNNVNTMLVDFNGNGESEGKFEEQTLSSHVKDARAAINFLKKKGYRIIDVLGSSASGPVAISLAADNPDINRVGLKSPVSDFYKRFEEKPIDNDYKGVTDWREKGYTYYTHSSGQKSKLNYSFYEDAKNHIAYEKAKNVKCPVLILHGDKDTGIDYRQSQKLAELLSEGSLIVVEGADHSLSIDWDTSYAEKMFVDWFKRSLEERE